MRRLLAALLLPLVLWSMLEYGRKEVECTELFCMNCKFRREVLDRYRGGG